MENSDNPNPESDRTDEQFRELLTSFELDKDAVAEVFEALSEHRDHLLAAVSRIDESSAVDPDVFDQIAEEIGLHSGGYFEALSKIPKTLLDSGASKDLVLTTIANQYAQFDSNLVSALSEQSGESGMFTGFKPEELHEVVSNFMEIAEGDIDQFTAITVNRLAAAAGSDISRYISHLQEIHKAKTSEEVRLKIDSTADNINELLVYTGDIMAILESQNESKSLKTRLGKPALDVAKLAAGSALGYLIAKKLSRGSN